jgi:HEAT repeat protein
MDDRPDAQILIKRVTDTSAAERVNAINALGAIRCLEACNCLSYALRDFDRLVRRSALRALENIGESAYYQIVHGLKFGSADVRELAAEVLGRMNNVDAVSPLTDALGDQDKLVRLSAVRALENIGKPAYPLIVHGLKFGSADVRELAAEVLGRMNNVDAVSPLTPSPGNKYVLYNVTLTNTNAQDRQVSPLFFALHDANNNVYNIQELTQSRYLSQAFPSGYTMTQPGDKVSGRIVFEVPQNVKLATMTYDDRSVMGSDNTYSHVVINL